MVDIAMPSPCKASSQEVSMQSRSRHFGGVSEKKNLLGLRDPKRISRSE